VVEVNDGPRAVVAAVSPSCLTGLAILCRSDPGRGKQCEGKSAASGYRGAGFRDGAISAMKLTPPRTKSG